MCLFLSLTSIGILGVQHELFKPQHVYWYMKLDLEALPSL